MSAIASTSSTSRTPLLRTIALSTLIIGLLDVILQQWLVLTYYLKIPFNTAFQYIASGLLGNAAFQGGLVTVLLGLVLHLFIIFVIASIFILSADRIPLLRRYAIPASLLYGFLVPVVMSFIVVPLSAAPALPMPAPIQLAELFLKNVVLVGLPLGIIVERSSNLN